MLGVFIIGILISVYYWYINDRVMLALSVGGNIFFWVGFFAGITEGTSIGRQLEREDIEERKE